MAVEILENTLLKLLVRRGTDADRRLITLASGELGYTTDTERLFIGNAVDNGGVVVGNKWQGSAADLTTLAPCVTGDYAFETDTNEFKIVTSGTGAAAGDWTIVSTYLSAGDNTITIDSKNHITVGKFSAGGGLSADNISPTALGDSITLDGSNKVSLSANINIDGITKRSSDSSYLSLPAELKVGTIQYDWPSNDPTNQSYLGSDANNNLAWSIPSIVDSAVAPTTASVLPVGTIVPFASAYSGDGPIPYGWLNCDGGSIQGTDYRDLSAVIGISYGGDTADPDTATTFKVPNLTNKLVYGSFVDDTAGSSLYPIASGVGLSAGPLSAAGVNYIIKAVGGVTSPTLTVGKNLSAWVNAQDKTDTQFDFLSGNIKIEKTPPGQIAYETDGRHDFTMPAGVHYVKYYVTGSGATAGDRSGGSAATAIGYLSAGPGTVFYCNVGKAPPLENGINGNSSFITMTGRAENDNIVEAGGGLTSSGKDLTPATVSFDEDAPQLLNCLEVEGGPGADGFSGTGRSTSVRGGASYWGSIPAPGGGSSKTDSDKHTDGTFGTFPGPGIIVIEWT